ncbi:hypothetical protein EYF80_041189 [Liparis tanakae]|uniref:Uncharacterized protein n=1 Tax=Liparis tanakae TaxID=230148 RepID=A0A4Z2G7P5_9TELE|nr:hypothetical protein EYF80_041189 [Liparis tanakae]
MNKAEKMRDRRGIMSRLQIINRRLRTYRGKLIVELGQHGVVDEDGRVLLQSLQLLQKKLLVLLAAVPGAHWLEQGLPCSVTPLEDHHLMPLRKKVLHKLPDVLLRYGVMEERHFAVDDSKYRWRAMGPETFLISAWLALLVTPKILYGSISGPACAAPVSSTERTTTTASGTDIRDAAITETFEHTTRRIAITLLEDARTFILDTVFKLGRHSRLSSAFTSKMRHRDTTAR